MTVASILNQVDQASGSNAKLAILRANKDNAILRKALEYGLDTYLKFGVVKVPETTTQLPLCDDSKEWTYFFQVLDECAKRNFTGNKAVQEIQNVFSVVDPDTEKWMRRILLKHFNIGVSRKTAFKVWEDLVKTFSVQLAAKWNEKTLDDLPNRVRVEPKLDGIRMVAKVSGGNVTMLSRAGKSITNFQDTVGKELATLPDGVYDGEVMDDDFIALMRQVHRKDNVNVTKSYFMVFDVVSLSEWENTEGIMPLSQRRLVLEEILGGKEFEFLRLVEHQEIDANINSIMAYHKLCVDRGFEGAMLKNPDMPYCFGRSDAVVKVKTFHDADVKVIGFKEGRESNAGSLGAIIVDFEGHEVDVGSGFSKEQRTEIWAAKEKFLGMTAEVRYQEITPKGSLRFPTFVCWRLDKPID